MLYQQEYYCKYCGAILDQEVCGYCGQENMVMFVTPEEYRELLKKNMYVPSNPVLGYPNTYMGKTVIVRKEGGYESISGW